MDFKFLKYIFFLNILLYIYMYNKDNQDNQDNINEIIVGIFLLILLVCSNFLESTLSCQFRKLLLNNMIAKNIIIFLTLFFTLNYTSIKRHPIDNLKIALIIFLFFILFNKTDIYFTLINFILLIVIIFINQLIKYEKYILEKENIEIISTKIENMIKIRNYFIYLLLFLIIIGFLLYFKKQYNDHKKNFNFLTFLLGKVNCDNLDINKI